MYELRQNEYSYKDHHHKKNNAIKLEEANRDYPLPKNNFKITQNLPNFGTPSNPHLEKLRSLVQITLENKIAVVFSIFETKVLTRLESGFHSIAQSKQPHLQVYAQKKKAQGLMQLFVEKVVHVWQEEKLKSSFTFLGNLKLLFGKGRSQNSKRQMLRINSKVDRDHEEQEFVDRNYNQATSNSEKTYKQLKKKKETAEKEFSAFKQQFEQLLSHHQAYLKKH